MSKESGESIETKHRREAQDFYATPNWCYELLNSYIDWDKVYTTMEPCCGDGRIVDWILKKNIKCVYSDIERRFDLPLLRVCDYLTTPMDKVDLIITNPPFSLAFEFLQKGLQESRSSCWLLRLNFLASNKRSKWFKEHEPDALYVLSKRPSFVNGKTDMTDYGWFIYDKLDIFKKHGIVHI